MHAMLIVLALALAWFGGIVCIRLLRSTQTWDSRRLVQLTGMLLPLSVLSMLAFSLAHFLPLVCFQGSPPADVAATGGLAIAGGLVGVAAFILNALRAALLGFYLRRRTWE